MASGRDEGAERYAGALEQQEAGHRSPMSSTRRSTSGNDPASNSDDPTMRTPALDPELREHLDLAAALRDAGRSAPGPDRDATARMRASLMEAIGGAVEMAPDEVDDQQEGRLLGGAGGRGTGRAGRRGAVRATSPGRRRRDDARPGDGRPERAGAEAGPRRGGRRRSRAGRIMGNVVTGTCAVLLLGALTVVLSRGALPGETLYGVKRSSESVEMGLTGGQEGKGRKHLEFAALRLEEVSGLVERGSTTAAGTGPTAAGLDPDEAALVSENLRSFDEQARAGSRLMLPLAGQPTGPAPAELAQWSREQSLRLDGLSPSLQGDDKTAAAGSKKLLERMNTRASTLDQRRSCPEVSTGEDELGPLPSDARCAATERKVVAPESTSEPTSTTSSRESNSSSETSTTTDESTESTAEKSTEPSPKVDPSTSTSTGRETPDPVQVPMPVPLMPPVDVPPLIPGMPGISLGN